MPQPTSDQLTVLLQRWSYPASGRRHWLAGMDPPFIKGYAQALAECSGELNDLVIGRELRSVDPKRCGETASVALRDHGIYITHAFVCGHPQGHEGRHLSSHKGLTCAWLGPEIQIIEQWEPAR